VERHLTGRAAFDKVAGQLASCAQGNRIDVVGDTDDVPVGRELARAVSHPTGSSPPRARAVVVRYLQQKGITGPRSSPRCPRGQCDPVASKEHCGRTSAETRRTELPHPPALRMVDRRGAFRDGLSSARPPGVARVRESHLQVLFPEVGEGKIA